MQIATGTPARQPAIPRPFPVGSSAVATTEKSAPSDSVALSSSRPQGSPVMDFARPALLCAIPGVGAFGNYVFASQANARFMEGHTASNIIGFGAQAVGSFALFHALISGDSTSLYVGLGMMGVSAVAAGAANVALNRPA